MVSRVVRSVVASTVVVAAPSPTVVLTVAGTGTVADVVLLTTMVGAETMQEQALDSALDGKGKWVWMALLKLWVNVVTVATPPLITSVSRNFSRRRVGCWVETNLETITS